VMPIYPEALIALINEISTLRMLLRVTDNG
jgi:hypothetical protein